MEKRESHKDIELNGKRYRINKFDALTGSYFSYMVMTHILPSLLKAGAKGIDNVQAEDLVGGLSKAGKTMSKEEFTSFQKDCLSVCQEIRSVGGVDACISVLQDTGVWGVPDLSHDTMTVMALTLHAVFFNVQGFFGEGGTSPLAAFKDLSLPQQKG